jgi:type I restriction enzyme S subunit
MVLEWRTATVAELQREGILLVEDGNHGEYRPRPDEFVDHGVAFIRAADMDGGRILFDSASKINDRARQRITKGVGAPGDVLLSHKGTVGKVALVPDDAPSFVCSPQTTFWRTLDPRVLDRKYLCAFLRSPGFQAQLATRAGETDMAPYVSLTSQRGLSVLLPPIQEQHAIARILGTLDDKIELNQQMNKSLEAIGKAVFKRWFIDFEFPNEEGKPYKSSGGEMLYKDALDKEIPAEWHFKAIDDVADFLNGLALQKFPAREGEEYLPVVKIRELRQGITESSDKANLDVSEKYVVNDGDVLFSWSGSLEVVIWGFGKGALNQHLFKVTSSKYPKWFFYYWVIHYLPEYRQIAADKVTTMGHIQRHHLTASQVAVPDDETLERMDRLFAPILEKIGRIKVETRILSEIRDLTLPKLMSGKIRVPVTNENVEVR